MADKAYLQLADWAPQGNALAYVKDNNIYYVSSFDNSQVKSIQLSNTGVLDVVYNGISDWVYEGKNMIFQKFLTIFYLGFFFINFRGDT